MVGYKKAKWYDCRERYVTAINSKNVNWITTMPQYIKNK